MSDGVLITTSKVPSLRDCYQGGSGEGRLRIRWLSPLWTRRRLPRGFYGFRRVNLPFPRPSLFLAVADMAATGVATTADIECAESSQATVLGRCDQVRTYILGFSHTPVLI